VVPLICDVKVIHMCLCSYTVQGIDPIVIMAKDGLFHGTPDEKEESARVIILLVHLSPVEVQHLL